MRECLESDQTLCRFERVLAELKDLKTAAVAQDPESIETSAVTLRKTFAELTPQEHADVASALANPSTALARLFTVTKHVVDANRRWYASPSSFDYPHHHSQVLAESNLRG